MIHAHSFKLFTKLNNNIWERLHVHPISLHVHLRLLHIHLLNSVSVRVRASSTDSFITEDFNLHTYILIIIQMTRGAKQMKRITVLLEVEKSNHFC